MTIYPASRIEEARRELESFIDFRGIQFLKEGDFESLDVHLASTDRKSRRSILRLLGVLILLAVLLNTSRILWGQPSVDTNGFMGAVITSNLLFFIFMVTHRKWRRQSVLAIARQGIPLL